MTEKPHHHTLRAGADQYEWWRPRRRPGSRNAHTWAASSSSRTGHGAAPWHLARATWHLVRAIEEIDRGDLVAIALVRAAARRLDASRLRLTRDWECGT